MLDGSWAKESVHVAIRAGDGVIPGVWEWRHTASRCRQWDFKNVLVAACLLGVSAV